MGEARDAEGAIAVVAAVSPDVVVLDVNMPCGGAVRATRQIVMDSPATAIVILLVDETMADVIALLNAGAMTYLRKGIDREALEENLVAAIHAHDQRVDGAPSFGTAAATAS